MGEQVCLLATLLLALTKSSLGQRPILPELPSPRLVLVGPSGSGKSSLANALLGCDPRLPDCIFPVCQGSDSCTKDTKIGTGHWLGSGQNFTIVDTPGFDDSDGEDELHMEEMMDTLANVLGHADTLVLVLKGDTERFGKSLQDMLAKMALIFGSRWWDYMVVGVSFWHYDQDSIDGRVCDPEYPQYCKDENWFRNNINGVMHEKFGVEKNFTFVFTDSWSQTAGPPGYNTEDNLQQEHWQEETGILWDITVSRDEPFSFMTIDDILEENARQRAEIKWLNDVITNNISELKDQVGLVNGRVTVNEGNIVQTNRRVDENSAYLEHSLHPVGTIISWFGSIHTGLDLPSGWQLCDGSAINRGPMKGQTTPDLNLAGLFIRGGPNNNVAGTVQEDAVHDHHHEDSGHSHEEISHSHSVPPHDHPLFLHDNTLYPVYVSVTESDDVDELCDIHTSWSGHLCMHRIWKTLDSSTLYTNDATATIKSAHAGLGGVDESKDGVDADAETRPKNMKLVFIIRVE